MRATIEEHCAKVMAVREYIKMIKDIVELPIQYPDEQSAKELQKLVVSRIFRTLVCSLWDE